MKCLAHSILPCEAQSIHRRRLAASWLLGMVVLALAGPVMGQSPAALPESLRDLFSQGVEAQKAGRLDDAEEAFKDVLARGGKVSYVYNNLGAVYQMQREHEKAVVQFREAIRLQPDYAAPRILAGASLLVLGKVKEATAQLERAVKLQPKDSLARQQLVRAYETSGNLRGLVEQYRALVELAPGNPEYVYQLGNAYLGFAAWCHREIGALSPDSARIHQTAAEKFLAEGHRDLAARAYQRAAELDPSLPEIHFSIALIYLEEGKPAEALGELEKELAIVPYSVAALSLREKIKAGGGSHP